MKRRLDQYLVEEGLCESREKAKRAIIAGQIRINGHKALKPSDIVREGTRIEVAEAEKFVSRGGHKLERALEYFHVNVEGWTAADLGASTGGFTDCLLQHGASKVYAIDVGKGQLAWALRQDPRVVVMEKVNARHLQRQQMPQPFSGTDLIVVDCSFISLTKILPAAVALGKVSSRIIALIKPQFEAGKAVVDQGKGVVRDPIVHQQVVTSLETFAVKKLDLSWHGTVESPILGPAGNKEFLCLMEINAHAGNQEDRPDRQSGQAPLAG